MYNVYTAGVEEIKSFKGYMHREYIIYTFVCRLYIERNF